MPLQNLTVGRICLHEVHVRSDAGAVVQPMFGTSLLDLQGAALEAFKSRVIAAFRSNAQCMEMTVRVHGPGSVLTNGVHLIGTSNQDFITASAPFAEALATAQTSRQIPGGLMVIFDGTVGNPATPFFGVMKAELHEGFEPHRVCRRLQLLRKWSHHEQDNEQVFT